MIRLITSSVTLSLLLLSLPSAQMVGRWCRNLLADGQFNTVGHDIFQHDTARVRSTTTQAFRLQMLGCTH